MNSIKSNSLRIGNYVKLRDSGEIVRVERITRRKVGFFHGNDKSRGYFRKYSEIEGALIYDHWREIEIWRCGLMHSGWDDGDEKYLYYLPVYPCRTVRYIHELQNLHHALTGEELKIEL